MIFLPLSKKSRSEIFQLFFLKKEAEAWLESRFSPVSIGFFRKYFFFPVWFHCGVGFSPLINRDCWVVDLNFKILALIWYDYVGIMRAMRDRFCKWKICGGGREG